MLSDTYSFSRNRLRPFTDISKAFMAFPKLTELELNDTLMTWSELEEIAFTIPSLRIVELGYNRLSSLSTHSRPNQSHLQMVNLDGNEIKDWVHICETFKVYSK